MALFATLMRARNCFARILTAAWRDGPIIPSSLSEALLRELFVMMRSRITPSLVPASICRALMSPGLTGRAPSLFCVAEVAGVFGAILLRGIFSDSCSAFSSALCGARLAASPSNAIPRCTRLRVSDHRGTKGVQIPLQGGGKPTGPPSPCVRQSSRVTGSPRSPGKGRTGVSSGQEPGRS
jgi:hypothetical protein